MPMYEYKCPQCGRIEEVLQGFNDGAPNCRVCSGSELEWKTRSLQIDDLADSGEDLSDSDLDLMVSWVVREKQKVDNKPLQAKVKMERLISRTSFQLVGDGWAKDGYGGNKP